MINNYKAPHMISIRYCIILVTIFLRMVKPQYWTAMAMHLLRIQGRDNRIFTFLFNFKFLRITYES